MRVAYYQLVTAKTLARAIYIVAAKRTPFGAFGGALETLSAIDLQVVAAKAAFEAGKVDPSVVGHVVVGEGAQVKATRLEDVVVMPGAKVNVAGSVSRCILAGEVGADSDLANAIRWGGETS